MQHIYTFARTHIDAVLSIQLIKTKANPKSCSTIVQRGFQIENQLNAFEKQGNE